MKDTILDIAREMRAAQRAYFQNRTPGNLARSKRLETLLDQALAGQTSMPLDKVQAVADINGPVKFVIWSRKHKLWWRENSAGYTFDIDQAGRYTSAESAEIVKPNINQPDSLRFLAPEMQHAQDFIAILRELDKVLYSVVVPKPVPLEG